CLFGFQFLSRRRDDDGFWRAGLSVQEAALSAGADGARDRDRRQGGRCLPPIDADVAGVAFDILQQHAGDEPGAARRRAAVAAADLAGGWQDDRAAAAETVRIAPLNVRGATVRDGDADGYSARARAPPRSLPEASRHARRA